MSSDAKSRTLSVSTKDRAAILPVGKSKANVYWYSLDGRFTTSAYYRDVLPPWVVEWNKRKLADGWFGKVRQGDQEGTSNVGSFGGKDGKAAGEATNVVTDYVHIRGEARSHDAKFFKTITQAYATAFQEAAAVITDDQGRRAKVKFLSRLDYFPFRIKDNAPVVKRAQAAAVAAGLTPTLRVGNGGLDANWMVRHKIPTVTFGAGQHQIHTVEEYVDVAMFLEGCKMALALAQQG